MRRPPRWTGALPPSPTLSAQRRVGLNTPPRPRLLPLRLLTGWSLRLEHPSHCHGHSRCEGHDGRPGPAECARPPGPGALLLGLPPRHARPVTSSSVAEPTRLYGKRRGQSPASPASSAAGHRHVTNPGQWQLSNSGLGASGTAFLSLFFAVSAVSAWNYWSLWEPFCTIRGMYFWSPKDGRNKWVQNTCDLRTRLSHCLSSEIPLCLDSFLCEIIAVFNV